MSRQTRKTIIVSLVYILLICVLMILCVDILSTSVAYAAETESKFDQVPVMDDLFFDGSKYKLSDYPLDDSKDFTVINVVEYGFPYYANQGSNYGLYVYIYNPAQLNLSQSIGNSAIQIADGFGSNDKPNSYKKYQLKYLNSSDDGRFYKYKVLDLEGEILSLQQRYNARSGERRYYISGVEIVVYGQRDSLKYGEYYNTSAKTVEKYCGLMLKYTGYGKGYGPDPSAESSLQVTVGDKITTQQLDVHHAVFRTDSLSQEGYNHYNQLTSVYFGIESDYLQNYGTLYGVKAEWDEYKTKDILVTDNQLMYESINKTIGIPTSQIGDSADRYQIASSTYSSTWTGWPFTWLSHNSVVFSSSSAAEFRMYHWGYNFDYAKKENDSLGFVDYHVLEDCPVLYYVFKVDNLEKEGERYVSSERLKNYISGYNRSFNEGTITIGNRTFSKDLFQDSVDEGRTMGHQTVEIFNRKDDGSGIDYTYDLIAHSDGMPWYVNTNYDDVGKEEYLNIYPIQEVYWDEIKDLSPELIRTRYYIEEHQVPEFKSYVQSCYDQGKVAHLFRFAATDYRSIPVQSAWEDKNGDIAYGYVSQETVFLNFDIIQLTYAKNGVYTVIPVCMDPIDIISDVTAPALLDDVLAAAKALKWWEILLIIIACIIGIIILVFIVKNLGPEILHGFVWLLKSPFLLLDKITKAIHNKAEQRRNAPPKPPKPPKKPKPQPKKKKRKRRKGSVKKPGTKAQPKSKAKATTTSKPKPKAAMSKAGNATKQHKSAKKKRSNTKRR